MESTREENGRKIGNDRRFVEERKYEIQALWEKHREIARQVVLGKTNIDIADAVGCTPQTVSNVRNSPLAQAEMERLGGMRDDDVVDMSQRIKDFAPVALELLEQIISGRIPSASIALRAKVAAGHLGRAGYGEVHKVQALHAHLSAEDIRNIKHRVMEAAVGAGVIEVEREE